MKPPCFDRVNKIDCPDRHGGCAATCPKWAAYERYKKKNYAERRAKAEGTEDYYLTRRNGLERYRKDLARRKKR